MREDKLSFGLIIRIFVSLLPILFGMPTVATIICAYNIAMTFIAVGPLATTVSSLCAVAAAMFLSSSFGVEGELAGLVLGLQAVFCACGCIIGIFKKKDFYYGLILGSAGMLIPQLIYANSAAHSRGMSLADMIVPKTEEFREIVSQSFATLPQEMNELMTLSGITVDSISQLMRSLTVMIIPSVLIISSMVTAYVVIWAVTAPLRKMHGERIHSFSKIKLSRICTVLSLALTAFLLYFMRGGNTVIITIALNMLIVILAMAFFSGISLMDFYLRKVLPIKLLRAVVHVLIAMNFFPVYILTAFIDSFANFRKLPKNNDKKGGVDYETKK